MATKIDSLHRYPIKGLNGQSLESVQLESGQGFPCDRKFGFARPNNGFDPNNPKPLPKTKFYMLARDSSLATLKSSFDENSGVLKLSTQDTTDQFDITGSTGKEAASQYLKRYLRLTGEETPQLYEASPHRFTDVSVVSTEMMNAVSLINLDSVHEFSQRIGRHVDPMRFRGNIQVSGLTPFKELDLVGQQFSIGDARLKVVKRTKRCPATEVDLNTGERNLNVPGLLKEHYDHKDMGIYAEVLQGGVIAPGDIIEFCKSMQSPSHCTSSLHSTY